MAKKTVPVLQSIMDGIKNSHQSEAKILADFVEDILHEDPANFALVASSMDEFIGWATLIRDSALKNIT